MLPSGQEVGAPRGTLSAEAIAALPTPALHFYQFPVNAGEVAGWEGMTKSAVKRAMRDLQWTKLAAEKARRRAAREASSSSGGGGGAGSKRDRADGGDGESGGGGGGEASSSGGGAGRAAKRARQAAEAAATSTEAPGLTIVVDCNFEKEMKAAEAASMRLQLTHCYGAARRSGRPVALIMTSLPTSYDAYYAAMTGFAAWQAGWYREHFTALFAAPGPITAADVRDVPGSVLYSPGRVHGAPPTSYGKDGLVYLTADSPHLITAFEPTKVYIVGGIVDRNRHKGLTARVAAEAGIATARLPLAENWDLRACAVLTTNHVVEIMVRVHNGATWTEALAAVLPMRKHGAAVAAAATAASGGGGGPSAHDGDDGDDGGGADDGGDGDGDGAPAGGAGVEA